MLLPFPLTGQGSIKENGPHNAAFGDFTTEKFLLSS
jgi:hypothetical protein